MVKCVLLHCFVLVALAQENRKCGADFKMDVAILLDASCQEFEFARGLDFARNVINFLPDIGNEVRISLVPYSWEMFKPTNDFTDNISKDSALSLTRFVAKIFAGYFVQNRMNFVDELCLTNEPEVRWTFTV